MNSSFLSEHSTEFVLIPKFCESLSSISAKITPIFFWTTREGATISRASYKNKSLLIVALYARRPKISSINSREIELKFNAELFNRSNYLINNGIPVFAGTPLVTKLDDFTLEAECRFFNILPEKSMDDEYVKIDTAGKLIERTSSCINIVNTNEIVKFIKATSQPLTWDAAVRVLKNNKYDDSESRWYFGNSYKPVYFILDISEKS